MGSITRKTDRKSTARLTEDQVVKALIECDGLVSPVARKFKTCSSTIYKWLEKSETCREARRLARENLLDDGESSLARAARGGESWAVCFLLKTQAKSRGYVERQEVTGADGGPVVTEYRLPARAASVEEWAQTSKQ
jgi:hypothetical protein